MADFQFPNINPGPVITDPGFGGTLSSSIAGVLSAMQEKQKLDREKAEFETRQQYYKTQTEGSALENEQKKFNLKKEQKALDAKQAGLDGYTQWVGSGANQADLGKIITSRFARDPEGAQDFVDRVTKHRQQENDAAIAADNAAKAAVDSATTTEQIAAKKSEASTAANQAITTGAEAAVAPAKAKADLRQVQAQTALANAQAEHLAGTQTEEIDKKAMNLYKMGRIKAKDAWSRYGGTVPQGIDPEAEFTAPSRGMQQFRARAKISAIHIGLANDEMDTLEKKGVKISAKTAMALKIPANQGRFLIPDDEQQMISAGQQAVSQYGYTISGVAVPEQEATRIAMQIMPQAGDKPGQLQTKAIHRRVIQTLIQDASSDQNRPASQLIGEMIRLNTGKVDPQFLKFLKDSQIKAANYEARMAADPSNDPAQVQAGTDPGTPDDVQNLLNSVGN